MILDYAIVGFVGFVIGGFVGVVIMACLSASKFDDIRNGRE